MSLISHGAFKKHSSVDGRDWKRFDVIRFAQDGVSFRGKLIGVLEVAEARGEKMCQEAMADLKMAIKAAGEHKRKIIIGIALDGLRLRDESSRDCLYHHPVHKISFIAQDANDSRAFGYVFGSPNLGHRFFGIKTEKNAQQVVQTIRDLFEVVFSMKKKEFEKADFFGTSSRRDSGKLERKDSSHQEPSVVESKNVSDDLLSINLGSTLPARIDRREPSRPVIRTMNSDPFGDSFNFGSLSRTDVSSTLGGSTRRRQTQNGASTELMLTTLPPPPRKSSAKSTSIKTAPSRENTGNPVPSKTVQNNPGVPHATSFGVNRTNDVLSKVRFDDEPRTPPSLGRPTKSHDKYAAFLELARAEQSPPIPCTFSKATLADFGWSFHDTQRPQDFADGSERVAEQKQNSGRVFANFACAKPIPEPEQRCPSPAGRNAFADDFGPSEFSSRGSLLGTFPEKLVSSGLSKAEDSFLARWENLSLSNAESKPDEESVVSVPESPRVLQNVSFEQREESERPVESLASSMGGRMFQRSYTIGGVEKLPPPIVHCLKSMGKSEEIGSMICESRTVDEPASTEEPFSKDFMTMEGNEKLSSSWSLQGEGTSICPQNDDVSEDDVGKSLPASELTEGNDVTANDSTLNEDFNGLESWTDMDKFSTAQDISDVDEDDTLRDGVSHLDHLDSMHTAAPSFVYEGDFLSANEALSPEPDITFPSVTSGASLQDVSQIASDYADKPKEAEDSSEASDSETFQVDNPSKIVSNDESSTYATCRESDSNPTVAEDADAVTVKDEPEVHPISVKTEEKVPEVPDKTAEDQLPKPAEVPPWMPDNPYLTSMMPPMFPPFMPPFAMPPCNMPPGSVDTEGQQKQAQEAFWRNYQQWLSAGAYFQQWGWMMERGMGGNAPGMPPFCPPPMFGPPPPPPSTAMYCPPMGSIPAPPPPPPRTADWYQRVWNREQDQRPNSALEFCGFQPRGMERMERGYLSPSKRSHMSDDRLYESALNWPWQQHQQHEPGSRMVSGQKHYQTYNPRISGKREFTSLPDTGHEVNSPPPALPPRSGRQMPRSAPKAELPKSLLANREVTLPDVDDAWRTFPSTSPLGFEAKKEAPEGFETSFDSNFCAANQKGGEESDPWNAKAVAGQSPLKHSTSVSIFRHEEDPFRDEFFESEACSSATVAERPEENSDDEDNWKASFQPFDFSKFS